jgi:large subunit ribosomal protein L30e
MSLTSLRDALKEKKIKFGVEEAKKLIKRGEVKEIFISSNCVLEVKEELKKYCEISGCKVNNLKESSKDLGAICRKPFSISVCCYLK